MRDKQEQRAYMKKYMKKYYQEHKEEIKARAADWRKQNLERAKSSVRHWAAVNEEKAKVYNKEWRMANKETIKAKNKVWREANKREISLGKRRDKYGISAEQYSALLIEQAGRCAICADPMDAPKEPCVDHCHKTDKIRGLLCRNCNTAIGLLKDCMEVCVSAASYLGNAGALWR